MIFLAPSEQTNEALVEAVRENLEGRLWTLNKGTTLDEDRQAGAYALAALTELAARLERTERERDRLGDMAREQDERATVAAYLLTTEHKPHSRVWFSPHGTEWEAETYEEALEMERDSLVEQYESARLDARQHELRMIAAQDARIEMQKERDELRRVVDDVLSPPLDVQSTEALRESHDKLRAAVPYPASRPTDA